MSRSKVAILEAFSALSGEGVEVSFDTQGSDSPTTARLHNSEPALRFRLYLPTLPHHSRSFALYILAMFRHSCLVALLALLAGFGLADHPENGVDKYLTVRRVVWTIEIVHALTHRMIEARYCVASVGCRYPR